MKEKEKRGEKKKNKRRGGGVKGYNLTAYTENCDVYCAENCANYVARTLIQN